LNISVRLQGAFDEAVFGAFRGASTNGQKIETIRQMGQSQLRIEALEKAFADRGPFIIQDGVFQVPEGQGVIDINLQEIINFGGDADSRVHYKNYMEAKIIPASCFLKQTGLQGLTRIEKYV
jgi:hypothetical protein